MASEREIQETIARCVSIMVFFHNTERSAHSRDMMAAEIGAVAQTVKSWAASEAVWERILKALNVELIARYGSELGVRLDGEFYRAFEAARGRSPSPRHPDRDHGVIILGNLMID